MADKQWLIDTLKDRALTCEKCELAKTRTKVVFGAGDLLSKFVVVGEAPGEDEDLQGEPFIGRSGQLLRESLAALGVVLPKIFITNTIMCRPPENRNPLPEELKACSDWLSTKLGLSEPRVLVAVGKYALGKLLGIPAEDIQRQVKITQIVRSRKVFDSKRLGEVFLPPFTIVPVVHPAFVLRGGCSKEDFIRQLGSAAVLAEKLKLDVFE